MPHRIIEQSRDWHPCNRFLDPLARSLSLWSSRASALQEPRDLLKACYDLRGLLLEAGGRWLEYSDGWHACRLIELLWSPGHAQVLDERIQAVARLNELWRSRHRSACAAAQPADLGTVLRMEGDLEEVILKVEDLATYLQQYSVLLREKMDSPQEQPPAENGDRAPEQYVDLDEAAAWVNLTKRGLEKYKKRKTDPLPDPDIKGGGGRKDEWKWATIRPWLERVFKRKLPERLPSVRRR